ncbi:MAG: hypothetical protein ACJ780_13965 [Solirubrobacteraceae bacterium]
MISRFAAGLVPGAILLFGLPWLAGRALSSHRVMTDELRVRTVQLEHEREERARLAAMQERDRLAVQINDVITRGIASMVSHATMGGQQWAVAPRSSGRCVRWSTTGGKR